MTGFSQQVAAKLLKVDLAECRREIRKLAGARPPRTGTDRWYQASHPVFVRRSEPRGPEDLIERIAFAYSWLATIPKSAPSKRQFKNLQAAVKAVRKASPDATIRAMKSRWVARAKLIDCMQRAMSIRTRTAIVAVSKVLHFWDPDLAPLMDGNVVSALPDLLALSEVKTAVAGTQRSHYLWYWEFAFQLSRNHRLTYHQLDKSLFRSGRAGRLKKAGRKKTRRATAVPSSQGGEGSKMSRATELYRKGVRAGQTRAEILRVFVEQVGLTKAGANTYYYNIRSALRRNSFNVNP